MKQMINVLKENYNWNWCASSYIYFTLNTQHQTIDFMISMPKRYMHIAEHNNYSDKFREKKE